MLLIALWTNHPMIYIHPVLYAIARTIPYGLSISSSNFLGNMNKNRSSKSKVVPGGLPGRGPAAGVLLQGCTMAQGGWFNHGPELHIKNIRFYCAAHPAFIASLRSMPLEIELRGHCGAHREVGAAWIPCRPAAGLLEGC